MAEQTAKKAAVPTPRTSTTNSERSAVDRTVELSEDVLKSVEAGQRAALDAVRKFAETVDEALPAGGEGTSRREKVVDAALEMADRLVTTQYDFLRGVVHDAGRAMGGSGAAKK